MTRTSTAYSPRSTENSENFTCHHEEDYLDRRVDREEKVAIAKAQTEGGQARGKHLEETIAKAVKAGQADARKHQSDHPD